MSTTAGHGDESTSKASVMYHGGREKQKGKHSYRIKYIPDERVGPRIEFVLDLVSVLVLSCTRSVCKTIGDTTISTNNDLVLTIYQIILHENLLRVYHGILSQVIQLSGRGIIESFVTNTETHPDVLISIPTIVVTKGHDVTYIKFVRQVNPRRTRITSKT